MEDENRLQRVDGITEMRPLGPVSEGLGTCVGFWPMYWQLAQLAGVAGRERETRIHTTNWDWPELDQI